MEQAEKQNTITAAPKKQGSFFGNGNASSFFAPVFIQPKLTVGPVDDQYEKEADSIADTVMRMSDKDMLQTKPSPISIQRKCSHCEEEEKLQMKANAPDNAGSTAPAIVYDAINSNGQPMDSQTRSFMESRFGYDFGTVRIHNDLTAHRSSKEIKAFAYTHGDHIVFGEGKYQPSSDSGKHLLAHELTHVVQQNNHTTSARIQRDPNKMEINLPDLVENYSTNQPLEGDPVPGYETARDAYAQNDKVAMQKALEARDLQNHTNVGNFLGEYSSAMLDLWGRYATDAMAKAADESSWALFGRVLDFVIKESLVAATGAWAAVKFGKIAVKLIETAVAFAGDEVSNAAQNSTANAKVGLEKTKLDAVTSKLADKLKTINTTILQLPMLRISRYSFWLGQAALPELHRFRLPVLFPATPRESIRSAVSQSIIGVLFGDYTYTKAGEENVISMNFETSKNNSIDKLTGFRFNVSKILAKELNNQQIKYLPNIPLHLELKADNSVNAIRSEIDDAFFPMDPITLEPARNIFGNIIEGAPYDAVDSMDVFVRSYPTKSPATIHRNAQGEVNLSDGGLMEHLYLSRLVAPGYNIGSIVQDIYDDYIKPMGTVNSTVLMAPDFLAQKIQNNLYPRMKPGAEIFIKKEVVTRPLIV